MHLNHPHLPSQWKNCLPQNQSPVPKSLGTAGILLKLQMPILSDSSTVTPPGNYLKITCTRTKRYTCKNTYFSCHILSLKKTITSESPLPRKSLHKLCRVTSKE